MKIWFQHGTEHSANLVMIGRFVDATEATKTSEIIEALANQVRKEVDNKTIVMDSSSDQFSEEMRALLRRLQVNSIGPPELEQFAYEIDVKVKGSELILKTEEIEVSAFFKLMFYRGAKIEIYSAHDYPETDIGRGK